MKVVLLNQYFHPDLAATAQIATELAEDLTRDGFEVTAVASRGSYLGGRRLPARDLHHGVEIVRVAATSLGKRTLIHRALDYASFYATAASRLLLLPRHDATIVLTTPPLIAMAALVTRTLRRTRLVYWVQDLYPDVAIAFGALRHNSVAARLMARTSRFIMRRSDLIIALGAEMRDRCVAAGAPRDRVRVLPNWSDADAVKPVPHHFNRLRPELAGGCRTVVMYSGNMGRCHDIGTLLAAAGKLRARPDVAVVFVGDGAKRGEVEHAARELPNVRVAPYQPRERLSESLSAGDIHLIALSSELAGLVEPSKLYGIMAAGRPVLFVGPPQSEVARTISAEQCGRVIRNGDADALADAIVELADNPAACESMGGRARAALESRYSRRIATAKLSALLRSL